MIYIMSMNLGSIWTNNVNIKPATTVITPKVFNNFDSLKHQRGTNRSSRAYWGTPTWFLFHTIAERINPTWYKNNYVYVWEFIKNVCNTLPCPLCQAHAIVYVNSINIIQLSTKEGLQHVLFNFHNTANRHSGATHQPMGVLKKYKRANIKVVFDHFENRFFHSYIGSRQFNDWKKNELKIKYYNFYNTVRTQFI